MFSAGSGPATKATKRTTSKAVTNPVTGKRLGPKEAAVATFAAEVKERRQEKTRKNIQKRISESLAKRRAGPEEKITTSTADIIFSLGERPTLPLRDGVYYNTCSKTIHTFENGKFLNRPLTAEDHIECVLKFSPKNYGKLNKYLDQQKSGVVTSLMKRAAEAAPLQKHDWGCVPGPRIDPATGVNEVDEEGNVVEYGCGDENPNFLYFMLSRKYSPYEYNPTEDALRALTPSIQPIIGGPEGIVEGTRGVWQMLPVDPADPVRQLYTVYAFIRNTIDFLHDFLKVGASQYGGLIAAFKTKYPWAAAHPTFIKWVPRIAEVITSGDNVNQNTCRSLCQELIEDFVKQAEIPWLVGTRANSLVATASLVDEAELESFFQTLVEDGVTGVYIESMMGSAAPLYVKAAQKGIKYVSIRSGDWDAGSGFSWEKAKKLAPTLTRFEINRTGPFDANTVQAPSVGGSPDTAWSSFGLNTIRLDERANGMLIEGITGNFILPANASGKPQKLSVNSICSTVGLPKIRGKKESGDEEGIAPLIVHMQNKNGSPGVVGSANRLDIMMPKAWTDTVQTVDSIANPITHKVGIVYSDILAELTGWFEGNKCSILYNDGKLHYYCYDTRARNMSEPVKLSKLQTRVYILANLTRLIDTYINPWFDTTLDALDYIIKNTTLPSIYLAAVRANALINIQQGIEKSKLPELLTALGIDPSAITQDTSVMEDIASIAAAASMDPNSLYQNIKKVKLLMDVGAILVCRFNPDGSVGIVDYEYKTVVTLPMTVDEFLNKITNSEEIIGAFNSIYETFQNISENFGEEVAITLAEGVTVAPQPLTRIQPVPFIDLIFQLLQNTINIMKGTSLETMYKLVGAVLGYGFSINPFYKTVTFSNAAAAVEIDRRTGHLKDSLSSAIAKVPFTTGYTEEEQGEISTILAFTLTSFHTFMLDDSTKVNTLIEPAAPAGGSRKTRRKYSNRTRSKRLHRKGRRTIRK